MNRRILQVGSLVMSMLLHSACGLTTDSAERIARAQQEMESGEYRAAMIELKNVLSSDPDNAKARTMLATVSLGLGDVEAAEKELTRAGGLGAAESAIRPIHLRILTAAGRYDDILASLSMESGGLSDEQILKFRGDALLGIGNVEAAMESYREWLRLQPDSADAAVAVASATAAGGDLQSAMNSLASVTAQHPGHVQGWHVLGLVRLQASMFDEAEHALVSAAAASKPQTDIMTYTEILGALTESQLVQGKKVEADRSLQLLRGITPQSPMTLLLAARLARSNGDYASASRYLQVLLNRNPNNTRAMLFLANVQLMQGNIGQAENLLHRIVVSAPDNIQARKLLARIQLRLEQPRSVIEALAPLLENERNDPDLYQLLAYANLQEGDPHLAVEMFRSAAELAPDDVSLKLALAAAYIDVDDALQALEVLESIPEGEDSTYRREQLLISALTIADRPEEADAFAGEILRNRQGDPGVVLLVSDHYVRTDREDDAQRLLQRHLAAGSPDVNVMNALAQIELSNENRDKAEALFLDVRSIESDNLAALLGLARIAELSDDDERKVRLLEMAIQAHDEAIVPRAWLAATHLEASRNNEAEILADELVAFGIRNAQVANIVGVVFMEVGRSDDALAHFQVAARLDQDSARMQLDLARAYLSQGRSVDAREALRKALTISPDWVPAVAVLALIELRQGRADDAWELVARLRRVHPESVAAMVLEGEVLAYRQEYKAAVAAFQRAIDGGAGRNAVLKAYQTMVDGNLSRPRLPLQQWLNSYPDDSTVRVFLAQQFQRNSDLSEAISEYNRVLQRHPDNVGVLNNLAWLCQQTGDLSRALELAEKAYSLDANTGSIADTLGWIYHELGRQEESLKLLTEASRLSPENREIRFHLAAVLVESGRTGKGRMLLEELINTNRQFPSRAKAEELLKVLQSEGGGTDA